MSDKPTLPRPMLCVAQKGLEGLETQPGGALHNLAEVSINDERKQPETQPTLNCQFM